MASAPATRRSSARSIRVYRPGDTIVAIASATGCAARGIVRASGPDCLRLAESVFKPDQPFSARDGLGPRSPRPTAVTGLVQTSNIPAPIPADLYAWLDKRSFTGEPVVELHTLGSQPLLNSILAALCRGGARLAEPGEFTLRAFLAGRIDLTQAEAVLGVIDARGDRDLQSALRQLAGSIGGPIGRTRDALLDLLAELETGLDFVDEDIEFVSNSQIRDALGAALRQVDSLMTQLSERAEGVVLPRVVLAGLPNVGKSSLFNRLVGTAEAIVSPTAGTTRDLVTARLSAAGFAFELVDTAGVGGGALSSIDAVARDFAIAEHERADVELFCVDAGRATTAWERARLAEEQPNRIVVLTKCDLGIGPWQAKLRAAILTSSESGAGIDQLERAIAALLDRSAGGEGPVATTVARCADSLRQARAALLAASAVAQSSGQEELIAADVRLAIGQLGLVVGAVYTDDLLDRIFSRFCIGK